jgi:hypothetical protein
MQKRLDGPSEILLRLIILQEEIADNISIDHDSAIGDVGSYMSVQETPEAFEQELKVFPGLVDRYTQVYRAYVRQSQRMDGRIIYIKTAVSFSCRHGTHWN